MFSSQDMFNKPPFCYLAHSYVCPCLFGGFCGTPLSGEGMESLLKVYMEEMYKLISSGRYETVGLDNVVLHNLTRYERDNFTVFI